LTGKSAETERKKMIQEGPELDRLKEEMSKSSMTTKDNAAEALRQLDEVEAKEFDWESNKDDENPEHIPWPEENESKE
jgi:hypothetical protein